MPDFDKILSGGDLRSTGKSDSVVLKIKNQHKFDELFSYFFHKDRIVVMRTADAVEKITVKEPGYLLKHKKEIIELSNAAKDKELIWHLALLIPRLNFNSKELGRAWNLLQNWAGNRDNSRIVRVNSVQGLFELVKKDPGLTKAFRQILFELEKENIPSINARIRKIRKDIPLS